MGKRRKQAVEEDPRKVVYTLDETIDLVALEELLPLMELPGEVSQRAYALLVAHKEAKRNQRGTITTKYYRGNDFESLDTGRVYAYPSIQGLKGTLNRLCCHSLYVDIDIRKCAPACLLHIGDTLFGKSMPSLSAYYERTEEFLDRVRSESRQINFVDLPDKVFKQAINSLIHGGNYEKVFLSNDVDTGPIDSLENIKNEVVTLRDMCIAHPEFEPMWDACVNRPNRRATFTSLIWQHIESQAIQKLVEFFDNEGIKPGVLKHDGLMVHWQTSTPFPDDVLRAAEAMLLRHGFHFDLVVKPLTPTADDVKFSYGRKHLHLLQDNTARVLHCIQRDAYSRGLCRVRSISGEVSVYAPHGSIPCVLVKYADCSALVNEVLIRDLPSVTMHNKAAVDWMETTSHPMFRLFTKLDFRRDRVAFVNGYLELGRPLVFHSWSGEEDFLTQHFIDRVLPGWCEATQSFNLPPTPLWDSILDFQLAEYVEKVDWTPSGKEEAGDESSWSKDRRVVDWLEAFIGRLNFQVNELDNWQVCPLSSVRIERRTFNPLVVGSNPTVGTYFWCVGGPVVDWRREHWQVYYSLYREGYVSR